MTTHVRLFTFLVLSFALVLPAVAGSGRIDGQVTHEDGHEVPGVAVVMAGTSSTTVTGGNGRFEFRNVREGTYELTFSQLDHQVSVGDVTVTSGKTTTVDQIVGWEVPFIETITVHSVSRRPERIVDAPAAVSSISQAEIERHAAHGLAPKLFEFTPGVDITNVGGDFLVSTRGFNSTLNRRLAIHIDGRDTTDPFIGAMEWSTVSFPLDEMSEVELLRGPTAALYGANATGGIVSFTTKDPRDNPGGMFRVSAGEDDTQNVEFRWAGALGNGWYTRVVGGSRQTDGSAVSRLTGTEYSFPCPTNAPECIPLDLFEFEHDDIDVAFGGVRVDKYLPDGTQFTIEAGTTNYDGPIFPQAFNRGQIVEVKRPWARFNYSRDHLNVLAYYNDRDAETTNLQTGAPFTLDAYNHSVEVQTNWSFADNKLRLVAGGSHFGESVESNIMLETMEVDEVALFAQADYTVNDHVKLVGALRWDDSDLHDSEISPKGGVVLSINPLHTLRLTYNEAFQLPTYAEYFLIFPIVPGGIDLTQLTAICDTNPVPIDCGFDNPVNGVLVGNANLEVEETTTYELGYKGVLGKKAFVTVEFYDSENQNFVSGAVPQVSPAGRINPDFGPWMGPSGITPPVEQAVRDAAALRLPATGELSNAGTDPVVVLLTLTTVGQVDTRGADFGLQYFVTDEWRLSMSFSWFEFDSGDVAGLGAVVFPNAPERKATLGLERVAAGWDIGVQGRWVDEFRWVNAVYEGDVGPYTAIDVSANRDLRGGFNIGVYVANVMDDDHWEAWGGDVIGRRAQAHVTYTWE